MTNWYEPKQFRKQNSGYQYPKFQKDYENEAKIKAGKRQKYATFWTVIFVITAALIYKFWTKPTNQINTVEIKNAPLAQKPIENIPAQTQAKSATTNAKTQEEKISPSVFKCTKDGKVTYTQTPCN
jgi:hypothetical protein